jgi:cell division protein FtsW
MVLKEWIDRNLKGDPVIWTVIILLALIGILGVYSAVSSLAYMKMSGNTEYYLVKHGLLVLTSLALVWGAHKINYKYYAGLSRIALVISVPLLLYAYFFGSNINEAQGRWLIIPIINQSFQPSDFAKLALIAAMARMLAKRQADIGNFKESFMPIVAWSGVICGIIALSNLSTAVMLFATCLLLMFIGRVPLKYISMLIVFGLLCVAIGLRAGSRLETTIDRVKKYIATFSAQEDISFQLKQGYIAISSGGLTGVGPGKSVYADFIPHAYSDFIYATLIEEYGMIGGIIVLLLYLVLLYRGMLIVSRSDRAFGGLLSAGLTFSLVIQAMINMGVAVGLGPVTGQPLPLISMGGTSLLFTGISLGIILSVSRGDISEDEPGNKSVFKEESDESDH